MKNIGRRNFLKKTSLSAASLYLAGSVGCSEKENNLSGGKYMGDFSASKLDTVRIALIGVVVMQNSWQVLKGQKLSPLLTCMKI